MKITPTKYAQIIQEYNFSKTLDELDKKYKSSNCGFVSRVQGVPSDLGWSWELPIEYLKVRRTGLEPVTKSLADFRSIPLNYRRNLLKTWLNHTRSGCFIFYNLMVFDSTDKQYIDTVKEIALNPDIYRVLWNEYKGILPSDRTLSSRLINDYGFNPKKVNNFLNNFRHTISYANLKEVKENVGETGEDEIKMDDGVTTHTVERAQMAEKGKKRYYIDLFDNKRATLEIEAPFKEEDLALIKETLDLIAKPLTRKKED